MSSLVGPLFESPVVVEEGEPAVVDGPLFPEEERAVERAIERRRAEFRAGRVLARRAMRTLGGTAEPLPPNDDRSPRWPDGFVGSISHTHGWVAVAVARASDVRSVGLDVERDAPVSEGVLERICLPEEQANLPGDPLVAARVVFSAKECFYKCQYPLTQQFLGFHEVRLEVDFGAGRFVAELLREAGLLAPGTTFAGRFRRAQGYVASGMVWTR